MHGEFVANALLCFSSELYLLTKILNLKLHNLGWSFLNFKLLFLSVNLKSMNEGCAVVE